MNYAKKLWKELKDYFQKIKRKPASGNGGGKEVVSKWKFLGAMMFFDPFMKHRQTSCSSLDLQSEAEMSPAADEDASDNRSSTVVVTNHNSLLAEVENDEDIDLEDETDIDLVTERKQPPQPSALPFTTDKPSSSKTPIFGGLQPPQRLYVPNMTRTTSTKRKADDDPIAAALQGTNQLISSMCQPQPESEDELFGLLAYI